MQLARVKPLGKPAKVFGLHNTAIDKAPNYDKTLALALRTEMEKYDGWITWNGLLFDLPFVDDRLMLAGHSPLERRFARGLDIMWHAAQGKSTFRSRRLEHVALALGYAKCREPLSETICEGARIETEEGLKKRSYYNRVLEHNTGCIEMTEFCYERLKPRIINISKR